MRGLRPLKLPAAAAFLGSVAVLARCSGDDTSQCDACADVTVTPLSVSLTPSEIWVHPGESAQISVALARGPGGDADAVITLDSDAGAAADPLTIPAGNVTGTLTVHVAPSFSQGDAQANIVAQAGAASASAALAVHVAGASGAPDLSFGSAGVADLSPSSGQDVARALVVLQSGFFVGGTHVELGDGGTVSSMKVLRLGGGGQLDSTFATTSAPGELFSLATLPDGRVFAVGDVRDTKADFAAVRVLASGGLDPTYAVVTPLTLADDVARAAIVEPGGRLVAAGSAGDASAFGVARYTQVPLPSDAGDAEAGDADAASDAISDAPIDTITSHLDPTFGEGGAVVTALAKPNAGATSMLVASDGSLYVLGYEANGSTEVVALHYDTSGALTQTVTVPLATGTYGAAAALLQPDGAIAIATDDNGQALVMRLSSAGALDATFGVGGLAALAIGPSSGARAVARDPVTGALYVGGFSGAPHQCFVARVTASGALDATFAQNGVLAITQGDACDVAALAVDGDRKIVVLETVTASGATHMAVARYWF